MQERGDHQPVESLSNEQRNHALMAEVTRANHARRGRKSWEVISAVQVVAEPFSVQEGTLTQTMKVVRRVVTQRYAADVASLMSRIR
jgi:long-chain acyl-CoA synthetase